MSVNRFLWGVSGPFLGVYVVIQNLNIPLIIQPQIFAFLCAISWTQVMWPPTHRIVCMLSVTSVSVLREEVAVTTVCYLRRDLYHLDGWIRGGDDLRSQGKHRPFHIESETLAKSRVSSI